MNELNDEWFRSLLNITMSTDNRVDQNDHDNLRAFVQLLSEERGYDSWIEAYHEFEVN
jgi:hypothetical protein